MPPVDPSGNFIVESRFGGTHYRTGAGRTLWGEGLHPKTTKEAKRQATKKAYRMTEKRKGKEDDNNNEHGARANESDSD